MSNLEISESKLIEALRQAEQGKADDQDAEGAMRAEDLAETLGWGIRRTRKLLKKLIEANVVENCKIPYTNIAGNNVPIPAYRLVERDDDVDLYSHP